MRKHAGRCAVALLTVTVVGGTLAVATPTAQAAPAAPTGLAPSHGDALRTDTPVLRWNRGKGADDYEVQVDDDPGFASPEFTLATPNTRAVPRVPLRSGDQYWRVRSLQDGARSSSWSTGDFEVPSAASPTLTGPDDGDLLEQPSDPPLLSWTSVSGATGYRVQVDTEPEFVGAKEYTSDVTALVVPDALTPTEYYWRVKAEKSGGVESEYSEPNAFTLGALPAPTVVSPDDNPGNSVQDVVLDWEPVAGAQYYQVRVSTDRDFAPSTIIDQPQKVLGTNYSPPVTYNNNQYFWQVRAVDTSGNPTAWSDNQPQFRREWPDVPRQVSPAPGASTQAADFFFQWDPVPHASYYDLQVGTDENFSPRTFNTCRIVGTTYAGGLTHFSETTGIAGPSADEECSPTDGVNYWRVRARDLPARDGGIQGIYTPTQSFTYAATTSSGGSSAPHAVSDLRLAQDGATLARGAGASCPVATGGSLVCDDVPSTPTFDWSPSPGATFYVVYVAEDDKFTNVVERPTALGATYNTMWAPTLAQSKSALAESQAGASYFVFVRPCSTVDRRTVCGPSPVSVSPSMALAQFKKKSPAVESLTPGEVYQTGDDRAGVEAVETVEIRFDWTDYRDTNAATTWSDTREQANQSAAKYRVQIDDDDTFATPLDTVIVDQSEYTAAAELYPEGPIYWRVQAIDADDNDLAWSAIRTFDKQSPAVELQPVDTVGGRTPVLRWEPEPFASSYEVEVYANGDTTFSPGNRVFAKTVKQTAYVSTESLPPGGSPYVWRVRRVDPSRNPGPWQTGDDVGRFDVERADLQLTGPSNGKYVSADELLLSWSGIPRATDFKVEIRDADDGRSVESTTTAANDYAPTRDLSDGDYEWRVTAQDSSRGAIAVTPWRTFEIDEEAPEVEERRPSGSARPTSSVTIVFNEPVKGVSAVSMQLVPDGRKTKVAARVSLTKGGIVATLNPRGRLRRGERYTLRLSSKIADRHGHRLAPYESTIYVS